MTPVLPLVFACGELKSMAFAAKIDAIELLEVGGSQPPLLLAFLNLKQARFDLDLIQAELVEASVL